jgi:peptide/nickel transport system substrate-binding protein
VVGGAAVALLYEGLVSIDRDGAIVPGLARSWSVDSTGTVYTFVLDPNAKASDGSRVGASQIAASFRRLLDPARPSPRAWVLDPIAGARAFARGEASEIAGIRVLSEDEIALTLESPRAAFLGLLAMPPAAVLAASGDVEGRVTTGPWVVSERVPSSHLHLVPNPHWHGTAPAFRTLSIRIIPEEFTRVAEFEVGNLDVLELPATQAKRLREDPRYAPRVQRQVALVTDYIGLNTQDPVLSDVRVRRALNHAVDVDRILLRVMDGLGVRATGAIPPGIPGSGGGAAWAHDPEKARALFAEARVPEGWTLQLWQRPSPIASQILEAVQSDLREVGIASEILQRDWGALKAAIDRGEVPGFFMNWYADYPDPENFLVPLFHSKNVGGGGNRTRFTDASVDSLLDALEREPDAEARVALARRIDARVHDAAPWIDLWHPAREVATSERVQGWRPHLVPACERWVEIAPVEAAAR